MTLEEAQVHGVDGRVGDYGAPQRACGLKQRTEYQTHDRGPQGPGEASFARQLMSKPEYERLNPYIGRCLQYRSKEQLLAQGRKYG